MQNDQKILYLSELGHTWILDVDGTLVKHNGYKIDGYDTLLDGVKEFFKKIPPEDKIILLTARKKEDLAKLENFLKENDIRYDFLLGDIPVGERILVNDIKPNGLNTAHSINKKRDLPFSLEYEIDNKL